MDVNKLPGMGGVYNSINLNAYHYAGNNPVKMVDPDGNWDEVVHYGKTVEWAKAVFNNNESIAKTIAIADYKTDTWFTSTDPFFGQEHHFNTNRDRGSEFSSGGRKDSRVVLSEKYLKEAIELYNSAGKQSPGDAKSTRSKALEKLGRGLHCLQDVHAHTDEYVEKSGIIGNLFGKWDHLNHMEADDVELGDKDGRINETEAATKKYLNRFKRATGAGK